MTFLNLDSVEALQTLEAGSVQLFVTSPPYDELRSYGGHSLNFEGTALEMYRTLCDGGVACWVVGAQVIGGSESLTPFKQAIFFVEMCGFRLHDTMIYEKANFSAADSTRYHQCFEYVLVLSKGKPKTFNPIMDKQNVCAGQTTFGRNGKRQKDGSFQERRRVVYGETGRRTNVWRGNTRGQEEPCQPLPHPAMMPRWLARDLIISWSNLGDLVADPMAGSGTVGLEAAALGRRWWLNDVNEEYVKAAKEDFQTRTEIQQPVAL